MTQEPERGQTTYNYSYSPTAGLGLTVTRKLQRRTRQMPVC